MSDMAAETEGLPGLHVVQIRYQDGERELPESDPVDAYAASGAYALLGEATIVEPEFPEEQRDEEPTVNLGSDRRRDRRGGGRGPARGQAGARRRRELRRRARRGGRAPAGARTGGADRPRLVRRPRRFQHSPHDPLRDARRHAGGGLGRSGLPPLARAVASGGAAADRPHPDGRRAQSRPARGAARPCHRHRHRRGGPRVPGRGSGSRRCSDLADRCDLLYLHVDSDILDERYVPNHRTKEPNGPSMEQVLAAIDTVMATGKVVAYAMVSIWADGEGGDVAVDSGVKLIAGGLESWRRHGSPEVASAG